MSLPVPNWGSESQRQADSEDKPIPAHRSDLPPLSNHDSSLGETGEAATRPLPPDQGSDRGPRDTETYVCPHSRHGRPRSPTIWFDARSEAPTERTPGTLRTYPLTQGSRRGPPDTGNHSSHHSQDTRSQSANRSIRSESEASIQRTHELGLSTASRARSGQGSHQHYLDVASHHSQGDRSPFYNSRLGSRSGVSIQRTYTRGPAGSEEAGSRPGSRRSHPEEASSPGYAETRIASQPSAPPVSTGTRHMRSPRRRPGGRLPWRRREASRCVQRAVAISTIALVVLVVLLIILECAVFRKKPDKPETS
jgi:hypothetical protein